jgi:hypothetical protein
MAYEKKFQPQIKKKLLFMNILKFMDDSNMPPSPPKKKKKKKRLKASALHFNYLFSSKRIRIIYPHIFLALYTRIDKTYLNN